MEYTDDLAKENPSSQEETYTSPDLSLFSPEFAELIVKLASAFSSNHLPLILSKDNLTYVQDLARTPNVLIAGTISSGKTQFIYNQLAAWLYYKKPEELKLIFCASKSVDYDCFGRLVNHFLASGSTKDPINTPFEFLTIVNGVLQELELRTQLLSAARVRDILQYNTLIKEGKLDGGAGHRLLPDIVMVIDDLFNFLTNDQIVNSLVLLTQNYSHTGFFILAATSQINSNLISKHLKANFTYRIAFKLMSQSDSRKILDIDGAEKLNAPEELMCYFNGRLIKAHQPYIEYLDLLNIIECIASQIGDSPLLFVEKSVFDFEEFDANDRDPLFEEAARLIVRHQQGSTSLIQRKLKLGYNRAGRIIEQLEAAKIVGLFEGSKLREVLIPDEYTLEQFLGTLDLPESYEQSVVEPLKKSNGFRTIEKLKLPVSTENQSSDIEKKIKPGLINKLINLFK